MKTSSKSLFTSSSPIATVFSRNRMENLGEIEVIMLKNYFSRTMMKRGEETRRKEKRRGGKRREEKRREEILQYNAMYCINVLG